MQKTIHKTPDKNHSRRLTAMLMLHRGDNVSYVARTLCCARSSVGRWINWFTLYGMEGLKPLPPSRECRLFISPLKHIKASYQRAKTIMLIIDNYIIHKSREMQHWLEQTLKFSVIYQPVYSPWVNRVELLWLALHEAIMHNHQCRNMWQLLKRVRHFMKTVSPFPGGKHGLAKV